MAQRRMISRSISVSEQMSHLSDTAKIIFTWAIPHADDFGLLPYSPMTLKAIVVPMMDITIDSFKKCINEIIDKGLWAEFSYENQKFYRVVKFFEHQTLKRDRNPQTILRINNEETIKKTWEKMTKLICDGYIDFQLEDDGIHLDPEVKGSEVKVCATHPKKNDKNPNNKKKEKSEEEKQLHKDVVELIDYFEKKYESSIGKKLIITSWARYIKQSKPFVKKLGVNRMKMLCDAYFITFDDKFIKQNMWSLGIFLTDNIINSLNNKYS